ncbi:hypothetical protein PR003_g6375 [Phytophthora rubi]|uniref:Uncharacterized protein n=1 Tax=Phytophthora rubi TaxID=129364 RepID=A0A6A4FGV0_9STRA|nr:hypothetical protein PR003_g6375 [Phytophthora rubi]
MDERGPQKLINFVQGALHALGRAPGVRVHVGGDELPEAVQRMSYHSAFAKVVSPWMALRRSLHDFQAGAGGGDTFAPKSRLTLASYDPAASCAA